jgi:hypothetical protein
MLPVAIGCHRYFSYAKSLSNEKAIFWVATTKTSVVRGAKKFIARHSSKFQAKVEN